MISSGIEEKKLNDLSVQSIIHTYKSDSQWEKRQIETGRLSEDVRETDENRKRAIRREKEAEKKNKRERGRLEGNMKDSERTWSVGVCVCVLSNGSPSTHLHVEDFIWALWLARDVAHFIGGLRLTARMKSSGWPLGSWGDWITYNKNAIRKTLSSSIFIIYFILMLSFSW